VGEVGISSVKREIRIIGWDDAPFGFGDRKTAIIGTVCRGGTWLDGVIRQDIRVDGHDASDRIVQAVNGSPHKRQLRVIMLDGTTFGGFNIVDMEKINKRTSLPVIAVVRDRPDFDSIRRALGRFSDSASRWELIKKAGPVKPIEVKNPKTGKIKKIWFQNRGIEPDIAKRIIKISSTRSFIPEPLRMAHLIAHGIGGCR
jgi:endonuclease V-like protein UPF0215 family